MSQPSILLPGIREVKSAHIFYFVYVVGIFCSNYCVDYCTYHRGILFIYEQMKGCILSSVV